MSVCVCVLGGYLWFWHCTNKDQEVWGREKNGGAEAEVCLQTKWDC